MTGTFSNGSRDESSLESLERDFMLMLQFDVAVDFYTPQPLTIPYRDIAGLVHKYTPNVLVQWRASVPLEDRRPMLVEIKYREAFAGEWRRWKHQIRQIRQFAATQGWIYCVFTEREIRTPYLENARFLLPYLRRETTPETEEWILATLAEYVESSPVMLMSVLYEDKWNQAGILPAIWKLMAQRRIGFDISEALRMETVIWPV